jgi:gas vesicle protein
MSSLGGKVITMSRDDSIGHDAFVLVSGLAIGALVGLAVGVLIAPHSGSVTRRKILRSAGEAKDHVSEVFDDLEETGRDILNDVKRATR